MSDLAMIVPETATVWRAPNGRRYFSRRAAVAVYARDRMRMSHELGDETDGYAPCWCTYCLDTSGVLLRRYVRFLMHCTKRRAS
jgi:hypothetical protein